MNYASTIDAVADRSGGAVALSDGVRALSYSQLRSQSERAAGALSGLGLNRGDAISIIAENRLEHVVLLIAAARLGLIYAPVHPTFQVRELEYVLTNARPRAIFADRGMVDRLREAAQRASFEIERLVIFDDVIASDSFAHFLRDAESADTLELPANHPLLLTYTSGTTSMPKPVLRSHAAELWSARNYGTGWGFEEGDRVLVAMPLAWVYGLCSLTQAALVAGATVRILPRFHPVRVLEVVEKEKITTFAGTVSMYPMLLDVLDEQPFDTSSLRKIFGGAESRNEDTIARTEARFGVRLNEAYALSECFPHLLIAPEHSNSAPFGTLGRPVAPEAEIRLVDENGNEVADGQVGEALLRCPGQMLEYYREPDLTRERVTEDGWLRTGDLLRKADDGYYFFVGRHSDLIIRGGTNISPLEIETVLIDHPAVQDALVTGVPALAKGEDIVAAVVLRTGAAASTEQLLAYLKSNLADYKVPQSIIFMDDTPKGKTGKKSRGDLRAMILAAAG